MSSKKFRNRGSVEKMFKSLEVADVEGRVGQDKEGEGAAALTSRSINKLVAISTMERNWVVAKFMLTATIVQGAKALKDFEARLDPLQVLPQRLVKDLSKVPCPEVVLCDQNRVDVQTLFDNLHKRMDGKFLLCRTITEAVNGVSLEAVVEDPSGKNVVILRLKNFTPSKYSLAVSDTGKDWLEWLPMGSYIAVKNTFASVVGGMEKKAPVLIWNDNPSEVVLLSPKKMKELFPELVWERSDVPFYRKCMFFISDLVWERSDVSFWDSAGKTDADVMETLTRKGNTAFVFKRYTDALRWYELALEYDVDVGEDNVGLVKIWSNKAAAFLGLGCCGKALESCDQVLGLDPNHIKAIFRKVKALIGLGRNIEAKTFINEKLSLIEDGDLRVLSGEIPEVTTHLTRSHNHVFQLTQKDQCPELVGPIECRPASSTSCRGVYALEDLEPGRVIVFHRCFAYLEACEVHALKKEVFEDELVGMIANKLTFSPDLGREIYKLWAGNKLKILEENDISRNTKVDMTRIRKVVARNAVLAPDAIAPTRCALSTIGAQVNHGCVDANVVGTYLSNHCFSIRVWKPIKQGEQLVLQWCQADKPLETRRMELKKFGITCACRLCQYEGNRDASTVQKFNKLWARLENTNAFYHGLNSLQRNASLQLNVPLDIVSQLNQLYEYAPDLNMLFLDHSIHDLCFALQTRKLFKKVIAICEKVFVVAQAASIADIAVETAILNMRCYLQLKMKTKTEEWFKQVEKSAAAGGIWVIWLDEAVRELEEGGVPVWDFLQAKFRV